MLGIVLADLVVRRDGVAVGQHARLKVTDLEQSPRVFRVFPNDALVLFNRPIVLLPVDVLLSALQDSVAV